MFHAPLDRTVDIDQAEALFHAAKHPKSFVSLDKSDHLLSNKADAEFVASTIAGWLPRQLERSDPVSRWESPAAPGEVVVDELNRAFARRVFTATHEWIADEPLHVGADLGPDPYAQLLAALGTCTSMTIRVVANCKGVALDHVRERLRHHREHVEDCETCEGDGARTVDVMEA